MRLRIDRLGHHGDGIAAGPVYVPRALPGEVVEGDVAAGRMERPAIVEPSPDRRRAPCPHYAACGGCALMHATDDFVARWKASVVEGALAAHGLTAPLRPVFTAAAQSRRRASLAGRRSRTGAIVGFHGRASGTLVDLGTCAVMAPALVAALPHLRMLVAEGATRRGEMTLSVTATGDGLDVAASGGRPLDAALLPAMSALAERAGIARLTWDGEPLAVRGPVRVTLGRAQVALPPAAFLQATQDGEAALVAAVREALAGARRVADLFCGAGTFALPLAESAAVHAADSGAAMVAALAAAGRQTPGLHAITTEVRDLFRRPLAADELDRNDAVVIDPPRAGAEAQVAEIGRSGLPLVAYVSCNPVTFARDAAILCAAGFRLDWVQVVDQFRWSTHIELAARFCQSDS